jgi:hypothetical protein
MHTFIHWLTGFFVAEDETLNACRGKDAHETVSAECGNEYAVGRPCLFCRIVCGFIQSVLGHFWPRLKTHCANAWAAEQAMVEASKNLPGAHGGKV